MSCHSWQVSKINSSPFINKLYISFFFIQSDRILQYIDSGEPDMYEYRLQWNLYSPDDALIVKNIYWAYSCFQVFIVLKYVVSRSRKFFLLLLVFSHDTIIELNMNFLWNVSIFGTYPKVKCVNGNEWRQWCLLVKHCMY